jgi:hypothetical protein
MMALIIVMPVMPLGVFFPRARVQQQIMEVTSARLSMVGSSLLDGWLADSTDTKYILYILRVGARKQPCSVICPKLPQIKGF